MQHTKTHLLYFTFIFLIISGFKAQEIKGVIVDSKTKEGIPFASIGIPSKAFGFITDEHGKFTYRITNETEKDTLQFTSIGYYPITLGFKQLKANCDNNVPIHLEQKVYELAVTTVRADEYISKVLGNKLNEDLTCADFNELRPVDTASIRRYKERGVSDKAAGIEIANKIKIKKGQQTFIDRIQFKICAGVNDTAIYRVNIYSEEKTVKRVITPVGIVKIVDCKNDLKEPIIVKTIGKTETHDIDLSKQNIQVSNDFIIALECIYSSNKQMNVGLKPAFFGSTELLMRWSNVDDWVKIPIINMTFVSATVSYKKNEKK